MDVGIGSARRLLRTNGTFTSIAWLKRPKQGPPYRRTPYYHSAKGHAETSGFLSHGFQATIISESASTDQNRIAGFAVEDRKGFGTTTER